MDCRRFGRPKSPALPSRFVEKNAGGDCHVQRIHVRRHGDYHQIVTGRHRGGRETGTFRTKHQTAIAAQICVRQFCRASMQMRRQATNASRPQCRQGCHQIIHPHQWLLKNRAHGTGNGPSLKWAAARLAHDEKMRAKRRATPHHRPKIFRAGNALHSGEQQRAR